MAAVGSINILFQAKTSTASNAIKGFQTVVNKSMEAIVWSAKAGTQAIQGIGSASLKLGAVAGAGAAGLATLATMAAEGAKQTQKFADSLGVPSKSLAALQRVGAKYGVTAERIVDAQKDLSEKISQAGAGSESYQVALKAIGVNYKDLINLRADEQFFKVSEAIQKMGNSGDQSARAMELMGDAGFDVLGMIKANGSNLRTMTREVENSNLSISNLERGSLLALSDSFVNLKASAGDFGLKISASLAPIIETFFSFLSEKLNIANATWGKIGPTFINTMAHSFGEALEKAKTFFTYMAKETQSLLEKLAGIGANGASSGSSWMSKTVTSVKIAIEGLAKDINGLDDRLDEKLSIGGFSLWGRKMLPNAGITSSAANRTRDISGDSIRSSKPGLLDEFAGAYNKTAKSFADTFGITAAQGFLAKVAQSTTNKTFWDDMLNLDGIIKVFKEFNFNTTGGKTWTEQLNASGATAKSTSANMSQQLTAQQINPNQIKLGNINDGGSVPQKQLAAQQATQQNTGAIVGVLTNIYKRLNINNVNLGALGAGV